MSNGGGEGGKEKEQEGKGKYGGGGEGHDYGRAIAKIAVAQICENVGFQSFQQSALETFSIVAVRYLREIGKNAHLYANLAGRTESNVFDIIQGLDDLGLAQGFVGASDVHRSVASSGTVREIIQYVNLEDEIPFARPVPHFPVIKRRNLTPSFLQTGQNPEGENVPAWLPAFPDPQTYAQTLVCKERAIDARMDRIEHVWQQRKAERSVLSLQKRLEGNGLVGTSGEPGDIGKAKQVAQSNPFLAPPLPYGEKEVSYVVCPVKISRKPVVHNQGPVVESVAPATRTDSGLRNSKDDDRKALQNMRSVVQFKFPARKKPLSVRGDLTLHNDVALTLPWFGNDDDDEKSEEERKAEPMLIDSIEKDDVVHALPWIGNDNDSEKDEKSEKETKAEPMLIDSVENPQALAQVKANLLTGSPDGKMNMLETQLQKEIVE